MKRWLLSGVLAASLLGTAAFGASETRVGGTRSVGRVNLGLSSGLVTTGGDYGGSFLAGVSFLVDRNSSVWLGLDTGILFGSGTGLPILLSILFQSPDKAHGVRPYLGGAIGPVIGVGGVGAFRPVTRDGVRLAILIRPGIRFQVAESLDMNVEMALGGLTGIFYISPSLGISIHL